MQIRSKRQSLPWKACTLNMRGELRVAAETGKKWGDLPVTCGALGARNGASSLTPKAVMSPVNLDASFQGRVQL